MDIYTLNSTFVREKLIDTFQSVVWTERYNDFGDIQLVVPATPEMISALPTGTFISTPESKEVMWIETQEITDGKLTVKGPSLLKVLSEMVVRTTDAPEIKEWAITSLSPGATITRIVEKMCMWSEYMDGSIDVGFDLTRQEIAGLHIGDSDTTYDPIDSLVPFGSLWTAVKTIADVYSLGMNIQLLSADAVSWELEFNCYNGRNLTSEMLGFGPTVRFTPTQDSLTDVKELYSTVGYKNVCHVFASNAAATLGMLGSVDVGDTSAIGFNRRSLLLNCDDITVDQVFSDIPTLIALLTQRGRDYLANNNYTRMVDGTIVPQSQYTYGIDYSLGDVVDLVSTSGLTQPARITEYIRTQDVTGEYAYPTVTVLDNPDFGPS